MDSREVAVEIFGFIVLLLAIVAVAAIGIAFITGFK